MHGQDSVIDDCRDGQVVEQVHELLPQATVVAALALVPEAIYFRNVLAFVVATKHVNFVRVLDLKSEQKAD